MGVVTNKKAGELLTELRKINKKVVGCVVLYFDRVVELEFDKEPTKTELEKLKTKLNAVSYELLEEIA